MKEELALQDKIRLLEKELGTLADRLGEHDKALGEIEDLKAEIKGLKLFLGRYHPEIKSEFPEILKKLRP